MNNNSQNTAIFYAMKYTEKIGETPQDKKEAQQQRIDGEYGYSSAKAASKYLNSEGWDSEALWIESLDALADNLDQRYKSGLSYDFLAFVSHAGPLGHFFDNPKDPVWGSCCAFLNAGWNWHGPGHILEKPAASSAALRQLTDRLQRIVKPEGHIMFIGCKTAKESEAPRTKELENPRKEGTPFWIDDVKKLRYKSYVHAIADLSQRHVLGSTIGVDLGDAQKHVQSFLINNQVPPYWVLVSPEQGRD